MILYCQKIFDNLYRTDGKVGNGSTAAATRHELATGDKVEGKYHVKKPNNGSSTFKSGLGRILMLDPVIRERQKMQLVIYRMH